MTEIRQIDAREHLARILESRGHGGAVATAIDLDTDTSTLAKWVRGTRPIPPHRLPRIMTLTPTIRPGDAPDAPAAPAAPTPEGLPDPPDSAPEDPGPAPDALPEDLDALEQAVLGARPSDRWSIPDAPDWGSTAPDAPGLDGSAFRAQVWLPVHEMAAMISGPPAAPVIIRLGRSDQGAAACAAAHRCADRLGLTEILASGHWTADLAIMAVYAWTMRMAIRESLAEAA